MAGSASVLVDGAPDILGGVARLFGKAASGRPESGAQSQYRPATTFSDLAVYAAIQKQREVGRMFDLKNPFYRVIDGRLGATALFEGRAISNYGSFDYLGLNQTPEVSEMAKAAIDECGSSVSASRLVAGQRRMHDLLEQELADFYRAEGCITFVSGYVTNVTVIGMLMSPEDLIVMDDLMHNSGITGAKLSGATVRNFRHNNLDDLEQILQECRNQYKNVLVVGEGLYSMDGDFPDLPRMIAIKKRYGAWLMLDEAHSLGVMGGTGRGVSEHFGIDPRQIDIWMGTLSKTLASCGGYICGSKELIEILKYQAPGLVYSVGLSPPATAAALAALRVLKREPERVAKLQANGRLFLQECAKAGLDTMTSAGLSVVPLMVSCPVRAARLTERLLQRGINALPILPPAVPARAARLRFFITAMHTAEQIRETVAVIAEELSSIARRQPMLERATLAVVAR